MDFQNGNIKIIQEKYFEASLFSFYNFLKCIFESKIIFAIANNQYGQNS